MRAGDLDSLGNMGTGTCEKIDSRDFGGDPKCIPASRSSFVRLLKEKFLRAAASRNANAANNHARGRVLASRRKNRSAMADCAERRKRARGQGLSKTS